MLRMKRSYLLTAAALGAALAPASASAAVFELGATPSKVVAPVCPKGTSPAACTIILTQVTALETKRDDFVYPTTVTRAGKIVAFTIGLSRLDPDRTRARADIHFLDHTYGGTTQAAITVLKPIGNRRFLRWAVRAESPFFHLQPYLGQVVQFPLDSSLPVLPGDVVALTVPTWAPVLSIQLPARHFAYRQSRTTSCNTPPSVSEAQVRPNQSARYLCNYPGTRVEYSATEVTTPVAENPIHAGDRP
jgi:hypothetical protein